MSLEQRRVLIAGGGPVGLLCAWLLARRGVPVRLFDENDSPQADPRAATTHPATLELLAEDGLAAERAGADAVATTLYGYTIETANIHTVSWPLIQSLVARLTSPVLVEGHIADPQEVRRALDLGAIAVVVGSAITRPEAITARFIEATQNNDLAQSKIESV